MDVGQLPPWPITPPRHGAVELRAFVDADVSLARELATDPYLPHIGTLPADADPDEALAWVRRQQGRHAEGVGFSFAVIDVASREAVGSAGLWLRELAAGRASVGYAMAPSARGRGLACDALVALTGFAWSIPELFRVVAYIEPWNAASMKTAEGAGYELEGLLRSHAEIDGRRRDMLSYAIIRPAASEEDAEGRRPAR